MRYEIHKTLPNEETLSRWNEFLGEADYATHYVTPGFFIDPYTVTGERFAILAVDDGRIVAVLTGTSSGASIQSGLGVRPQTAFALECERARAAKALVDGLKDLASDDVQLINFFSYQPIPGMAELGYASHVCVGTDQIVVLDCSMGSEALFKEFGERRRRKLRSAIRDKKIEVKTLETEAELNAFYEIHKNWNERKGRIPVSFERFKLGASQTDYRKIFIALHEGKLIAGTSFRFCRGGMVEGAANHSLTEYQRLAPNELIMWRAIEWACEEGFRSFSMGGSHHFLTKFGGELVTTYRYRLDRTVLKLHNNRDRISRLAIKTYQSLPVSVRQRIKAVVPRV
jgi:hypothetical protein